MQMSRVSASFRHGIKKVTLSFFLRAPGGIELFYQELVRLNRIGEACPVHFLNLDVGSTGNA